MIAGWLGLAVRLQTKMEEQTAARDNCDKHGTRPQRCCNREAVADRDGLQPDDRTENRKSDDRGNSVSLMMAAGSEGILPKQS